MTWMDSDQGKTPGLRYMTKKTLGFMIRTAWQKKKIVFFLYFVKFLGGALGELKLLLLPKLLVDEVVAMSRGESLEQHLQRAILYVGLTLAAELLSRVLGNIADSSLSYFQIWFDRELTYLLCDKTMSMDFEHTEDPRVLDQRTKAQEGISWYSNGVIGILGGLYDVIYNVLLLFTSVTLFIFYCPLILPIQIAGMGLITYFRFRSQKIETEAFLKLGKINRLFSYYLYEVASQKFGKDARLYDSVDLMTGRADRFGKECLQVFYERANGTLKYDYTGNIVNAAQTTINDSGEASGIETIENSNIGKAKEIYSLDGRRLNAAQKGVNIVKFEDGTTKKIVVK